MQNIKNYILKLYNEGALHIFIGNFITKFVAFFASLFIVRLFSKSDYGLLGYAENIFGYIYLLAGFGLTNSLLRYIVVSEDKNKKYKIYNYVIKKSTLINVGITILALVILFFLYPYPLDFKMVKYLIPFIVLSLPFHSLTDSTIMALRSLFKNKKYAYLSCALGVSVVVGKYIFSRVFGIKGAFCSNLIIYGIWAIILMIIVRNDFPKKPEAVLLDKKEKKEIDVYSFQYMVTNGLWTIFMLNDIFLLGRILGDSSIVADYKVAYALPGNISLFSSSIGIFAAPYFVKHEKDNPWIKKYYGLLMGGSIVLIGLVVLILVVWAGPIISFLYGKEYVNVVPVMRMLLLASLINNIFRYTNANLLSAMGKVRVNLYVSAVGIILQVILDMLLIPKYGMMGVATASVIVYLMMAMAVIVTFYKLFLRRRAE